MKVIGKFEGVNIYLTKISIFEKGAAVSLPGIGIIIGKYNVNNIDLLRHEFGHILQKRNKGFFYFWLFIAPQSFVSAIKSHLSKKHFHKYFWTELSANKLSFIYFNSPEDWSFDKFPIEK